MDQEREIVLRDRFLTFLTLGGLALAAGTELLSSFEALSRTWIVLYWAAFLVLAALRLRGPVPLPRFDPVVAAYCAAIGAVITLTAVTAAFSPPNSSDAMAYHMPRVVYWAQQGSIRFFPTQYLNQIMLQPLAEYAMLHLYVLAGSDHLTNFVQWTSALGSIVGVSAVAAQFGANGRAQALVALFCATLPAGILAASGAKNDWVLALWIVTAVSFGLQGKHLLLGIAVGCALLTKGTAYLFLPPLLLATTRIPVPRAAAALGIALAINTPHYVRNLHLSGSPLGYDSAQGDGHFRWRNETFGWRQTASNALRHISEQLPGRSERWNQRVYASVLAAHQWIGARTDDPDTTWRGAVYTTPKNANHEANAPNRNHLLILAVACLPLLRGPRSRPAVYYAASIGVAFLFACFYLKWQPFMARLFLPLLVASAPLVATVRLPILQAAIALTMLDAARLPTLENWVRPLEGPRSVLDVPREEQYFSDLGAWDNRSSYEAAVQHLVDNPCRSVGLDITHLQIEYPAMALLRNRAPSAAFQHTGVDNSSTRYAPPAATTPCAVVCFDCEGDAARLARYDSLPRSVPAGRFVLFFAR